MRNNALVHLPRKERLCLAFAAIGQDQFFQDSAELARNDLNSSIGSISPMEPISPYMLPRKKKAAASKMTAAKTLSICSREGLSR